MDEPRFDALARRVSAVTTRSTAMRVTAAAILGFVGITTLQEDGEARNRRRRRNRQRGGRDNCGAQYAGCNNGGDCCSGLVCQELRNPSIEADFDGTCAYPVGCGKKNDYCRKNRDCCRKFHCRGRKCKRR